MMKNEKLVGGQRNFRIGTSLIVRELHLVRALQQLNHRANLAATKPLGGQVCEQCDDVE